MKQISCVIPAYNEEKQIQSVLQVLCPLLSSRLKEIIVVDDSSADRTREIVKNFTAVTLVEHAENMGKSKAIANGIKQASGAYILMIDADLIGLEKENILNLIEPILNNEADITISYRGNTPRWWIRQFKIETLSGERCFSRDFLTPYLQSIAILPPYGLEVFINQKIINAKLRIKSVPMDNVRIDFKWHKHGLFVGVWKEILMWRDIFSLIGPFNLALQVLKLKKLTVRTH